MGTRPELSRGQRASLTREERDRGRSIAVAVARPEWALSSIAVRNGAQVEDDDGEDDLDVVTITAFGHRFVDHPAGLAENLITLEREGAIYSHFADPATIQPDGTADFRYYRVPLLPAEVFQYVEASIAYQEFHQAVESAEADAGDVGDGYPDWLEIGLAGVSNPEIADRVRRYGNYGRSKMRNGDEVDIRGCHASFYPDGLEAVVCGARRERYEELPEIGARDKLALAMQLLNNLPVAARILGERQRSRPPFAIESEFDVQDLLFAVLRSVFQDARREEWTPQRAGSAKRIDVILPASHVVVEAKYVRNRRHAKEVADELRVDFECYHDHEYCEHLIALVWDPHRHISDPEQFSSDLSGLRQKGDHTFEVTVLVR
jgi:REase_DpnII-MboI